MLSKRYESTEKTVKIGYMYTPNKINYRILWFTIVYYCIHVLQ